MSSDNTNSLQNNFINLSISEPEHSPSPNPWNDGQDTALAPSRELKTPDPSTMPDELNAHIPTDEGHPQPRVNEQVLNEFDPLVDAKEGEARQAWESSEGHPMPPKPLSLPSPTDPYPAVPGPSSEGRASSSATTGIGSGLSSLANLARSFSIPKVRTRSVEIAQPVSVITPNTLSTFAAQQSSRPGTPLSAPAHKTEWVSHGSSSSSSGNASPNPRKSHERQTDEPPQFDFQLFLDQMKSKSAEPVAKYLRSFLSNFAKKSLAINEQIKVINEFLNFIAIRMREADVWRNATDDEFDNAMEAMEKLVMNRLYEFTFIPQLAEAQPPRQMTTDDLERDRILAQRIALFGWVEERHLDVPEPTGSGGFLMFAQQELLKINHYKAPRDKLICVLNCCKVIFGLIRHLRKEENADSFVPILIFVVLKANPPNLISNIEYIQRFRNPQKLQSEAGYYLSSLMGAVQFIETMDHTGLSNITAEEFERNVEFAIHNLPASPQPLDKPIPVTPPPSSRPSTPARSSSLSAFSSLPSTSARVPRGNLLAPVSPHAGEESAQPLALSLGGLGAGGVTGNLADDTRRFLQRTGDAIGKPLNALGRILGEALDGLDTIPPGAAGGRRESLTGAGAFESHVSAGGMGGEGVSTPPIATPYKPRIRQTLSGGISPSTISGQSPNPVGTSGFNTPDSRYGALSTPSRVAPGSYPARAGGELGYGFGSSIPSHLSAPLSDGEGVSRTPTPALDLAGVQAEIDLAHSRAADASLGTLMQIFPGVDQEIVEWVLEAEGGDLGRSIEKLLEVGGG